MQNKIIQLKIIPLAIIFLSITLFQGCTSLSKKSINNNSSDSGEVVVIVTNIESNKGNLLVFIHDNEYSYYNDENSLDSSLTPFQMVKIPARGPSTKIIFDHVPHGKYAISAYHDENSDGRLNRMIFPFIGMPYESYGLSNAAFSYLSKGSFEQALIDINARENHIKINLSSHLRKTFTSK